MVSVQQVSNMAKVTKNQFISALTAYKEAKEEYDSLNNFDKKLSSSLFGYAGTIFDIFMHTNFSQSACEIVDAWLFSRLSDVNIDTTKIEIDTPEDLWNFIAESAYINKNEAMKMYNSNTKDRWKQN